MNLLFLCLLLANSAVGHSETPGTQTIRGEQLEGVETAAGEMPQIHLMEDFSQTWVRPDIVAKKDYKYYNNTILYVTFRENSLE